MAKRKKTENNEQENEVIFLRNEEAEEAIKIKDSIFRLKENEDFKFVFLDTLLKKEPVRLTSLLGDPNMSDNHEKIYQELVAIGKMENWLRVKIILGREAENQLSKNKENDNVSSATSNYVV